MAPARRRHDRRPLAFLASAVAIVAWATTASAAPVPVRYQIGTARGFLVLRDMDGKLLAHGEQVQTVEQNRITKRLTFHFIDGSLDDEQTTYSQDGMLRLITYHHTQKGPS